MLIHLLIMLILYGAVFYCLWLIVNMLPPPFVRPAQIVLLLIAVVLLLELILPIAGGPIGTTCAGRLIC